jgi:hypothetical protein
METDKKVLINEILIEIKKSKKYKNLSEDFIATEIEKYLKSNPYLNKITKQDLKEIKSKLHRFYSSYQTGKKAKLNLYLEELKKSENKDQILKTADKILSTTISAKERLKDYEYIYNEIFELTEKPETIVDIGSGLNPVSYVYMNLEKLNYYAYEINNKDIEFLNNYFSIMKRYGLNGEAGILDARKIRSLDKIPDSDIVFLFKIIDLIDEKNKKISEELIKYLINKTNYIITSFATKTLTRKSMNLPKRIGFEKMLERIGLNFKYFKTNNEIFYIIEKD